MTNWHNDFVLQYLVEEAVEFIFGDWDEGHGIGSSDVSAVMNSVIPRVDGLFDIDLDKLRSMVNDEIARVTGDSDD